MHVHHSVVMLVLLLFLDCIHSLNCGTNCYSIQLNDVQPLQPSSSVWCYEYGTQFTNSCNVNGDVRVLFGIDTNQCYLNRRELQHILYSAYPSQYIIYEDDSNNNPIGIEFIPNTPNDTITLCIDGTHQATAAHPLRVSDNNNICQTTLESAPDFCNSCLTSSVSTCYCSSTSSRCSQADKPDGRTICQWDQVNKRCTMELDTTCRSDPTPCFCFISEDGCDAARIEGNLDCEWLDEFTACVPTDCIDNLQCSCFKTSEDCLNIVEDFPEVCIWNEDDECVPLPSTTPTPTNCFDKCSCYGTQGECESEIVEHWLDCMWTDECVNQTVTTTEQPSTTVCYDKCECYGDQGECEAAFMEYPLDCIWTDECVNNTITTTEDTITTTSVPPRITVTNDIITTQMETTTPTTDVPTYRWSKRPTSNWRRPTMRPSRRSGWTRTPTAGNNWWSGNRNNNHNYNNGGYHSNYNNGYEWNEGWNSNSYYGNRNNRNNRRSKGQP
eukprot:963327_1